MKFIKNSIDSEYLQDSISDADLEKEMANCDMETEFLNGLHAEGTNISEKSNKEGLGIAKLSNGINGNTASPVKCNGKVNGFYEEEEEDFNLVLEDSSEGGESPSKKIDDDAISAPQIVQEIEDLLGINSSSDGIQEELNNLDGTESIEDNLDNVEDLEDNDNNSQEDIQEVFEGIDGEKVEKCEGIDKEKKDSTKESNKVLDKTPEASECDTSSHMNLVFDEVEVGLENGESNSPNETKITSESDELECKAESTTEVINDREIKELTSSENLDKTKEIISQADHSQVENSGKTDELVETTSAEIPLTETSDSFEDSEECMVIDAINTSDKQKNSEYQEPSKNTEVSKGDIPIEKCTGSEINLKSKADCVPIEKDKAEAVKPLVETKDTFESPASTSSPPSEGCGIRKRSASEDIEEEEEVEIKKPKLEDQSCLVETTGSPTVLKRPLPETAENDSKRSKLDETTGESKLLDDDDCQEQVCSEKDDDEIQIEFVKENHATDVPMENVLDSEENESRHDITNKKEEAETGVSSGLNSENGGEVKSVNVSDQKPQDEIMSNVSAPKENDRENKIDSTCTKSTSSSKEGKEITLKEEEPSLITTSVSKQSSDNIVADNTKTNCEESKIKSEEKTKDSVVLEEKRTSDENKENVSSIGGIIDTPKEESRLKLEDLSSVRSKDSNKSDQINQVRERLAKAENKVTELSKKFSMSTELSSSIKELEKSINKSGHEKAHSSGDVKNKDSKKLTNLDFAIERVVEKARFQSEKKVPILKKFHKDQLKKLKRSELEDIVVSKICEAVTYKSEIGQMRLRTQNLEETNDMWRKKVQQIEKQNRELEMVLKRFLAELAHIKRENQNKVPMPIKVTRSVGLQVVLASSMHGALVASRNKANAEAAQQQQQQAAKAKQMEKEKEKVKEPVKSTTFMPPSNSSLVRGRGRPPKTPMPQNSRPSTSQSTSQNSRPSTPQTASPKITPPTTPAKPNFTPVKTIPTPNKDLEVIDLTDKEERAKSASQSPVSGSIRVAPSTQVCFVQQTAAPSTPQQPLYLVQKAGQRPQFLVATSSASPQRPMASLSRPPPALALPVFRAGGHLIPVQTTSQGVKTSTNTTPTAVARQVPQALRIQPQAPVNKHPAPLPAAPAVASKPGMKAPPPKPQLKIAKTNNGIMLSWSMGLTKDMAEMQSYQLYAYQEGNQPPSTGLWKKVGDVKALPLPMACTLTQFIEGHKYHFAVRAVDTHGRIGPFSTPSSILLTK